MCAQNSTPDASSFQEILIETIDQVLTNRGWLTKNAVYRFLETNYNLRKKDIPHNIGEFVKALEEMFGAGALLIEIEVMKNMRQKIPSLKLEAEDADFDFKKYIESAKHFI